MFEDELEGLTEAEFLEILGQYGAVGISLDEQELD